MCVGALPAEVLWDFHYAQRVVDYLRAPGCLHIDQRSKDFSDGGSITLCPHCSDFDQQRQAVLSAGKIDRATPGYLAFWDARLNKLGLTMSRGFVRNLAADISTRAAAEDQNDFSDTDDSNLTARVNTAGWVGTDHEGSKSDSSVRDRKAASIRKRKSERVPGPMGQRCLYCGLYFANLKRAAKCCCEDHQKRYWEGKTDLDPVAKIIIRRR